MRTRSGSCRWVVKRAWPGLRRWSHCWMSGSLKGRRGGTPSTTQPIAGPWLSPKVVKRNRVPKGFEDMASVRATRLFGEVRAAEQLGNCAGGIDRQDADDMVACIDVVHCAGDAARQIAQ